MSVVKFSFIFFIFGLLNVEILEYKTTLVIRLWNRKTVFVVVLHHNCFENGWKHHWTLTFCGQQYSIMTRSPRWLQSCCPGKKIFLGSSMRNSRINWNLNKQSRSWPSAQCIEAILVTQRNGETSVLLLKVLQLLSSHLGDFHPPCTPRVWDKRDVVAGYRKRPREWIQHRVGCIDKMCEWGYLLGSWLNQWTGVCLKAYSLPCVILWHHVW